VAQGEGPELKPQYLKKKERKKDHRMAVLNENNEVATVLLSLQKPFLRISVPYTSLPLALLLQGLWSPLDSETRIF
jgi:hypothetical protein